MRKQPFRCRTRYKYKHNTKFTVRCFCLKGRSGILYCMHYQANHHVNSFHELCLRWNV